MKVFVATKEGQGIRQSDFSHAEEGELVYFSTECMTGFDTGIDTTTFKVLDTNLTKDEYPEKYRTAKIASGFYGDGEEARSDSLISTDVEILLEAANAFPEGIVLEKRGQDIQTHPQFSWTHPPDED